MGLTIVDMTGDGIWPEMSKLIRDELIAPFFQVDWKIHDISLPTRDKTDDQNLNDAIADLKTFKSGVKGPTITPNPTQTKDMGLAKQWGSPNGILRRAINGAVIMRTPLMASNLPINAPAMAGVTIARQAVGGIYGAPNFNIPKTGSMKVVYTDENGNEQTMCEKDVTPGVAMLSLETNSSIKDFARATIQQALAMNKSITFASKCTILPVYDGRFVEIFEEVFQDYKDQFKTKGLNLFSGELIDAAVSKIPQGKNNGVILALKNYDGDVTSDQVAGEHISLGMMDSILTSADGTLLADPPHGTAPDLDKFWHEEGKLVANPTAYIFAYAEAIRHKADLEGDNDTVNNAIALKKATLSTIEAGHMTGDLSHAAGVKAITGQEFVAHAKDTMETMIR
ncbi:MAG: isocitrate/isopropylmalate family dehydrogenase [Alphaproteobacteria bacterium]